MDKYIYRWIPIFLGLSALVVFTVHAQSSDETTFSQVILSAAECGDTIDNDGDTFIDFPADPDCTSLLDNSESPPPPSGGGTLPEPTLDARLEAFPTIGTAPLNGVDFQVWTLGFARGPINYTFYCDWNDPTTTIAPPWDAKIDNTFFNPYIVKDICAYEAPGLYTPKVIVEREDLSVAVFTTVEVLWIVPPGSESEPVPTPTPTPTPIPGTEDASGTGQTSEPNAGIGFVSTPVTKSAPTLEPGFTSEPTPEPYSEPKSESVQKPDNELVPRQEPKSPMDISENRTFVFSWLWLILLVAVLLLLFILIWQRRRWDVTKT